MFHNYINATQKCDFLAQTLSKLYNLQLKIQNANCNKAALIIPIVLQSRGCKNCRTDFLQVAQ